MKLTQQQAQALGIVGKAPRRPATGPPKLSEAEFTKQVLSLAKLKGWRSAHFRPAQSQSGRWLTAVQGDGKGWPDLFLVRGNRQVAAELKVGRNKTTDEQSHWLYALQHTGTEVHIWYPRNWAEIESVLE